MSIVKKDGCHLNSFHLDQLIEVLPKLKNKEIVITHVSRRTAIRRARNLLRKRVGDERMQHIHFLMDFDGSRDDGDVESTGLGNETEMPPAAAE